MKVRLKRGYEERWKDYWTERAEAFIARNPHPPPLRIIDDFKKYIANAHVDFESVVDAGCGVGSLYPVFDDKKLCGIEWIETMVAECRIRYPDIKTICGDIRELDEYFKPGEYDALFTSAVLEHIPGEHILQIVDKITKIFKIAIINEPVELHARWRAEHCYIYKYEVIFDKFNWEMTYDLVTGLEGPSKVKLMVFEPRRESAESD